MLLIKKILLIALTTAVPVSGATLLAAKELKQQYPKKSFLEQIKAFAGYSKGNNDNGPLPVAPANAIAEFLKEDSETKKADDLVKNILKSRTGSQLLFEKIVEILIDKWSENHHKLWDNSAIFKTFSDKKSKIKKDIESSEALQSTITMNKGQKDDYAKISLLDHYQNLLINVLEENLDIYLNDEVVESSDYDDSNFKADKNNFVINATDPKKDNTKKLVSLKGSKLRDKFKSELSLIWESIFEHWYDTEKPTYIKQFTWRYADSFQNNEHAFKKDDEGLIKLPDKPNYQFPSFSQESENNFKEFVERLQDTDKDLTKYNGFDSSKVIDIFQNNLDSREAISLLKLKTSGTFNNKNVVKHENHNGKSKTQQNSHITASNLTRSNGGKSNLLSLFGIDPTNTVANNASQAVDFVYVSDTKGIFYRDKLGVHYITKNVEDSNLKKELLIETLYKQKVSDNKKFDLFVVLKTHLRKNFNALLMGYFYQNNVTKIAAKPSPDVDNCTALQQKCVINDASCAASNEKCLYQVGDLLLKIFKSEDTRNKILKLNHIVLKDYFQPLNSNLITLSDDGKMTSVEKLLKTYSVKFPNEVNWQTNTFTKPAKPLIDLVTNIFTPTTTTTTTVDKLSQDITTSFTSYKSNVDKLFTGKSATKKSGSSVFSFITTPSTAANEQSINIEILIESIFQKSISENWIQKLLINKQKKDRIKNYDFSGYKYKYSGVNGLFTQNYYMINKDPKTQEEEFIKFFNNAVAMENNLYSLFNEDGFFAYRDWNDIKNKETLLTFIKNSETKKRSVNSSDYKDELSNSYSEFLDQINTAYWLIKDDFENYRQYLKTSIATEGFGAYLFTNKFDSKLCSNITYSERDRSTLERLWKYQNNFTSIKQSFDHKFDSSDNNNCVNMYDQFSVVATKVGASNKEISGYKGFVHAKNHENIKNLPNNAWTEVTKLLKANQDFKSGHMNTINQHYSTYLIALRLNDLKDKDSFNKFLKDNSIGLDVILRDVVMVSKDKNLQKNSEENYLTKTTPDYKKFITGDVRLQNSLPYIWQKPENK